MYTVVYDTVYERLRAFTDSVFVVLGCYECKNFEKQATIDTYMCILNLSNSYNNFVDSVKSFETD